MRGASRADKKSGYELSIRCGYSRLTCAIDSIPWARVKPKAGAGVLTDMSIQVKYFAALRDEMGRADDVLDSGEVRTVSDVWTKVSGQGALPPNTLAAVNAEYAEAEQPVQDGDEVAFFPPVTGG